jgi:hypothetical protein
MQYEWSCQKASATNVPGDIAWRGATQGSTESDLPFGQKAPTRFTGQQGDRDSFRLANGFSARSGDVAATQRNTAET